LFTTAKKIKSDNSMATYAIGDIQGCFDALITLLDHIKFDPANDTLWFTGDLVNRGSQSLETLRFIKNLGDKHITILGNHDLHLLAVAYNMKNQKSGDTLDAILNANDRTQLIDWLRSKPLLHHDPSYGCIMVHAGLAPLWTIDHAKTLAHEVEAQLRGANPDYFLGNMYGDQPDLWRDDLIDTDRLRCITNYLTRLRFCFADGRIDLAYKGQIKHKPNDLIPWFDMPNHIPATTKIIFGHWAALEGHVANPQFVALDTGCVWGNCLTAYRLEDQVRFSIDCTK
jgi:bis(5'-nucleosyl)-tetraphosphatase (symmetrical)